MKLDTVVVHHGGGAGSDNFASTQHHTVAIYDEHHKQRGFPKSQLGYFVGYSAVYEPRTRKFTQTQKLGEETAHTVGQNFSSFGLAIVGNYNRRPIGSPTGSVDSLTEAQIADVAGFVHDLINGNKRGLLTVPGTELSFSTSRIYPHRTFKPTTDCYGTYWSDTFWRDEVIRYKVAPQVDDSEITRLQKENSTLKQLILKLFAMILAKPQPVLSGDSDGLECGSS